MNHPKPTLAIIAANGFGDALVQMVLANNMARQGFNVTLFSNIGSQLDALVQDYCIRPFPDYAQLQTTFDAYDVSLYDSSGSYVRGMPEDVETWCKHNAICFRMSDAPPRHQAITETTIVNQLPEGFKHLAPKLKRLNAALRGQYRGVYRPPVVEQLVGYLHNAAGLTDVTSSNGLAKAEVNRNNTKILLHPSSSNTRKNWPAENFIDLAVRLRQRGYQPVITVSPAERAYWLELCGTVCEVPLFESISELAEFYCDAHCFIGNDSGNGHLASCLGIPTIQLFMGWKKHPAWRAGWAKNKVIVANFPYNLIKKSWYKGVSVEKVLKEFDVIQAEFDVDSN